MIVTPEAEKELKGYIAYLRSVKKNPQAVRNIILGMMRLSILLIYFTGLKILRIS